MRTSQNTLETISTIGIDVGKNTFHLVGSTSAVRLFCSRRPPDINSDAYGCFQR